MNKRVFVALAVFAAEDGEKRAGYELPSPPVRDGLAAARGRRYVSLMDGTITCRAGAD